MRLISRVALCTALISSLTLSRADLGRVLVFDAAKDLVAGAQVEASSSAGEKYSVGNILDGDAATRWAAGGKDATPSISVKFAQPTALDTIALIVTDQPRLYMTVKTLRIEFSTGHEVTHELDDRGGMFLIRFPEQQAEWFKLTLVEPWEQRTYWGLNALLAFSDPQGLVKLRVAPRQLWANPDLTETGRESHPCVFITPAHVARAHGNIDRYPWARQVANEIVTQADEICTRDAEWIRANRPGKGAVFAYGPGRCPTCGGVIGTWGLGTGVCSFDRPGTIKCQGPEGHIFPNEQYPDDGSGYVDAEGRVTYFVGTYNAFAVESYQRWIGTLGTAYSLTGDDKYAKTAALLLDAIAEIYPSCDKGSWDYAGRSGEGVSGRLNRPQYQTARVLAPLVDAYDRMYESPALDAPSFVEGLTRRENINTNLMKNGAWYCYVQSLSGPLHNGAADYIRGALAVGCLLGIEAYVDWAVDGPYGIHSMLANNVDRDGHYFETSHSYSNSTRRLYLTFADPLANYRSDRYPQGLNLYDDSRFRAFYVLPQLSVDCVGHWPRYGDSAPDVARVAPPERYYDTTDYRLAERVYAGASDPRVKVEFGELLEFLAAGDVEALRARDGEHGWMLFHAEGVELTGRAPAEYLTRAITNTIVMGQKGMAFLRTPAGPYAQAAMVRYGPTLNHGHLDDLNLSYFALGYELTYDLGYGNGATNTQVGWGRQTASHQLVMVNEKPQRPSAEDQTGGSLHLCLGMPGLQAMDMDVNGCYASEGVDLYRRMVALVGDGPGSYLLDIFTVHGGQQHDYILHALSESAELTGVQLSPPAPGSLAGADIDWGEHVGRDGFLLGGTRRPYWNPPPGNGLGFLMRPARARTDAGWQVDWTLPTEGDHLRVSVAAQPGTEVITAWAPGIYPHLPNARYAIARRSSDGDGLRSRFVAAMEPYGPGAAPDPARAGVEAPLRPFIEAVTSLPAPEGVTGVRVDHISGIADKFIYSLGNGTQTCDDLALDGTLGHVRSRGGNVLAAHVVGRSLKAPGFECTLAGGDRTGKVVRVDYEHNRIHVDADLPVDGRLRYQTIVFSGPAYARNTAYTIHDVRSEGGLSVIDLGPQKTILGKAVVEEDPHGSTPVTSMVPHDYARGRAGNPRFFDGKLLVSAEYRPVTHVVSTEHAQPFVIEVADGTGISAGDVLHYADVQAGDDFIIRNWAAVSVDDAGQPHVTATDDLTLTIGGATHNVRWTAR